jgi:hypothetical protein
MQKLGKVVIPGQLMWNMHDGVDFVRITMPS